MKYELIYQFCLENYENEFQMLDRINITSKNYHQDMMDVERYTYDLNFFDHQNPMILVDIIPPFLEPIIKKFNFDNYPNEKYLMFDILNEVKEYVQNKYDPEQCLVIQLIHQIPNDEISNK